jgi:hypothetical protein
MNLPGSYKAEAYNMQTNSFQATSDLAIQITVDETFDNDHRVVSQTSTSSENPSKFTFSAADSGLHRLCFTPSGPRAAAHGGWFSGGGTDLGGVKLSLDLAIGATSKIESDDKGKIEGIVGKVRELNGRLMDIRREQVFQRVRSGAPPNGNFCAWPPVLSNTKQEREAEFRDQSETTNARVVRWTLIQLGVLGVTCAWQLSHLRAFFIKQKLT